MQTFILLFNQGNIHYSQNDIIRWSRISSFIKTNLLFILIYFYCIIIQFFLDEIQNMEL